MTRVLIVDDHPIVLQGCRQVLQDAGVSELFEADTAVGAYRLFRRRRPDVVILDLALRSGGLGGLELIRRLKLHDRLVAILVFSMHSDPVIVSRALKAGAMGYVLKDAGPREFLVAYETVRSRKPYLSHQMALDVALLDSTNDKNRLPVAITPRELETLALLAQGKSYGEIATELAVSYKTVVNTSSHLKAKLGARNLPELIRQAIQYISSGPERLEMVRTSRS